MQISFYVLGERFIQAGTPQHVIPSKEINVTAEAVNAEAVIHFICQLTQTVLNKSEHSLVIVDDDSKRQQRLDTQLWEFDPTSFIPHNLSVSDAMQASDLNAPVTLTANLPQGFDGVVLNLAAAALPLKNNAGLPERVLEIITPDETSKAQGRQKYRHYRDLGFELIYYPIK